MKILITGSTGFIGKHLLPELKLIADVVELQSDLRHHEAVKQEVLDAQPDIVVHLAARTEVQESFYEQIPFSEINYVGTVNLIESCALLSHVPYFVFASTMEVYGWQPISDEVEKTGTYKHSIAFDEKTTANPNAPYAVAKLGCEKYLEYASRAYGLDFAAIRQTNSYGRDDNNYFVTEQIITQMLDQKEINLGYAEPYRNFLYIDDLISAWICVITNRDKCKNRVYTLGPDDPRKIKHCVEYIAEQLEWTGKVNWDTKPPRHGEIYWLNSNGDLFTSATGWKSKVCYEEGIERTIHKWRTR